MEERLRKQMDFILRADKMKNITRQTYLADGSRKENDAEHSFHLALMASILLEYNEEKVDKARVMEMVLVHDIVEIEAGDTYAYDPEGNKTKEQREKKAAEDLFGLLPDDQCRYYKGLWEEFEAKETAESHFANTLDHIQPILLTDAADGKSWKEHGVKKSWIGTRNRDTGEGSPELGKLAVELLEKNIRNGNIKNE
ncbi:MAG TPA: HD domain-containing protein [Lachnospiraceae bacterium]|nr:HD domain-containing protein [Lachnospiraceae bacterium]